MTNNGAMYTNVMEQLNFEPMLDTSNITISIHGDHDIVILGGTVKSFSEKLIAEKAIKRLAKVRSIANEIEVEFSTKNHKNDIEIVEEVTNALKKHYITASKNIQSVVKNGIVTLTGDVDWNYQKNSAFNAINNLFGIKSIINNIKVNPSILINSSQVKEQITKDFERHARIDANNIKVSIEGAKIILTGTVRNYDEMDAAEDAAWSISGVQEVENNLTIEW